MATMLRCKLWQLNMKTMQLDRYFKSSHMAYKFLWKQGEKGDFGKIKLWQLGWSQTPKIFVCIQLCWNTLRAYTRRSVTQAVIQFYLCSVYRTWTIIPMSSAGMQASQVLAFVCCMCLHQVGSSHRQLKECTQRWYVSTNLPSPDSRI